MSVLDTSAAIVDLSEIYDGEEATEILAIADAEGTFEDEIFAHGITVKVSVTASQPGTSYDITWN
jgi:hypothetical protein